MKKDITIGEKYGPAMSITDPKEAAAYFEECVLHSMSFGRNREEAERVEKMNLGYYAGYYDDETRKRVEKLFNCAHPVFGPIVNGVPTAEECIAAGQQAAVEELNGRLR